MENNYQYCFDSLISLKEEYSDLFNKIKKNENKIEMIEQIEKRVDDLFLDLCAHTSLLAVFLKKKEK